MNSYKLLQVISQDKTKRLEYEVREKAIRDYNQLMYETEERGKEIRQYENAISVAKNMLALNFPLETIAQITGLSEEQIKDLQKNI